MRPAPDIIAPESVGSLHGLFLERVRRTPDAIGYRQYDAIAQRWRDYAWREVEVQVGRWRAAFAALPLERGDRVAIMARNCVEWIVFEQAALAQGLVVVPLYINDRPDNIAYILNDAGVRVLLVGGAEQWQIVAAALDELPHTPVIIVLEPVNDTRALLAERWLPPQSASMVSASVADTDLATIVYTSGTTGRPKGVMLSHRNLLWNARACLHCVEIYPQDLFLSFLPLSHTLERTVGSYLPMMAGATVAYARSIALLAEDLVQVRPTVLISVPRVYERVHLRIEQKFASPLARRLFEAAVAVGWQRFEHRQRRAGWHPKLLLWPVVDLLLARPLRYKLGGRLRVAICGGAPLQPRIARTFIGFGVNLLQGYGMTEASPVIATNQTDDNDPTSVGRALRDVQVRIGKDDELQVHGPGVMLGYWNLPQATADAVDSGGWLHTGDQAKIEQGRIYITGRLKDILVLANGEKVPPSDMEHAISADPLFEQVMVLGDGRPYLAALAVLNPATRARLNLPPMTPEVFEEWLLARVGALLHDFPGYAQVRRIAVVDEAWTVDNGLCTPTLKLKRNHIIERHRHIIEYLYQGH